MDMVNCQTSTLRLITANGADPALSFKKELVLLVG